MVASKKTRYYDEMPEMSAPEVADSLIEALGSEQFEFLTVNFANPDMVGHTGNLEAAISAVETVDFHLGRVLKVSNKHGYSTIVTADHGNADQMIDPEAGKQFTAHTANNVPFILLLSPEHQTDLSNSKPVKIRNDGLLGNIAPTILELMGIPKPPEMTCESLLI